MSTQDNVSRETNQDRRRPLVVAHIVVSPRTIDALDTGAQELYSLAEGVHYACYDTPEDAEDAAQNFTELGKELERIAEAIGNLLRKNQ